MYQECAFEYISTVFDDVRQDGSDYCEDHRDHDGVVLLSC